MGKFQKKPVVVEAIQFVKNIRGTNLFEICQFIGGEDGKDFIVRPPYMIGVVTEDGTTWANPGDWIIKGVAGEFYKCKPGIFEQTYEKVEENQELS